jgi:CubicO group peptidase (beta-lactamase class C family)
MPDRVAARRLEVSGKVVAPVASVEVEVDPEQVGLDPARLARLDRHLAGYVDDGRLPGTLVVVARAGKVAHVAAHGYRDPDSSQPVEPDTIWRIYSMTKPVTTVAAMMLYEEGAFDLLDPVSRFLPSFADMRVYQAGPWMEPLTAPAREPVRIWHLLTHTSGLSYGFFYNHAVDAIYRASGFEPFVDRENYTLAEACERWARIPLLFEPGSEWNYSVSTDVLARVVEVISGSSIADFFANRILGPLGMDSTGYFVAGEDRARIAALYGPDLSTGKMVPSPSPDRVVPSERPRYCGGGHGLLSTALDYHRFAEMLRRGGQLDGVRLLSRTTVELMTRNHLPGGADIDTYGRPLATEGPYNGIGFGLGLSVLLDPAAARHAGSAGTFGWGGAATTEFFVDPANELTVAFYTQLLPPHGPLRRQLRQMTYQALID